jgi:hypothetical protein
MKTICIALFLLCSSACVLIAQTDSTRYEYGLPVTEDDTATDFPSTDLYPPTNYREVNVTDLPGRVRKALTKQDQYRGWEKGLLYFDQNTKIYFVEVPRGDDVHVFGLSKSGKPVSFDIYTRKNRQ